MADAAADWSVLSLEGVTEEIERQSGSVATAFDTYIKAEDLEQEAAIYCAEHPAWVRDCLAVGPQYFATALWRRLRDMVRTEAAHQSRTIGIHRLYENAE